FVPRSIQRIKDTEMVAFVKRVDLEIPDNRITEALTKVGLDVINVIRLTRKDGNAPTSRDVHRGAAAAAPPLSQR
ncbi:unnamed protein product, partial [Rotaria magnacalcarata]